jgi:DNA topoisomerase I
MSRNLLIVESPAKAKTIEKYLGKDFTVLSSYGHIRDLDKGDKGIDVEGGFIPHYIVTPEKRKVVKVLKDWVKKTDEVWLATDEDREGEAISWHLCEVLGLDTATTKRIVFREITKSAIQKAVREPRTVDIGLVDAQQARRILDRLVGFRLSEVLWRKIKGKLSAGRVQSVAVKLIVEREREIQNFDAIAFFKLVAEFSVVTDNGTQKFKASLPRKIESHEEAETLINACIDADFAVDDIEVKPVKRRPSAPFITSTLQQDASRKLGFGVKRTMIVAQKLYEKGFITYMRTDSTNLSETALGNIADEIQKSFGERYVHTRRYKKKNAGAQEAHEAIRPAYIDRQNVTNDRDEQRLYELIWKRTIASQMSDAQLERTKVRIKISSLPGEFLEATGEVLKFDGFLKVYMESKDDDNNEETSGMLPVLTVGQKLDMAYMDGTERFSRPSSRYTEASLVKKLEELGIGRPSTYAPTISRIMEPARGYVTKESRDGVERKYRVLHLENGQVSSKIESEMTGATSKRLFPSDMGMLVTDFLSKHFSNIMDYSFTAEMEKKFDTIAGEELVWTEMIKDFYGPFKDNVDKTIENAVRERGRRELGKDELTGHTILTQMTRFGPVVQIGTREEVGDEGKPKFANLRPGQSIESISLEEALDLFQLPKTVGEYNEKEVIIGVGRFGPYVKYNGGFISLPKGEDPMSVSLERAVELIVAKEEENKPIGEYKGKPITKGKGRFGPFIKWDGMFVNIPRKYDPSTLTLEESHELIAIKVEKEKNRYIHRWEKEKLALENGRWGPFIRKGKKSIPIPKIDGNKISTEQAKKLTLDDVKKIVEGEVPKVLKEMLSE